MILQQFQFPKPGLCTDEPLYFRRGTKVYYAWNEDVIYFDMDGACEFDTYFNGFSAEKFFKYTVVDKVNICLKFQGVFRVTIMRKEKQGAKLFTEFMDELVISSPDEVTEVNLPFNSKNQMGMYCIKLAGMRNGCKFFGGYYWADIPEEKVRNVKIGIDICTFKREKFVQNNVKNLQSAFYDDKSSPMNGHLEVFISDNAQTLPEGIGDDNFVHVFKNKNVGGAGGFTRGLIEIIRNGNPHGITHALIMDDDIVLAPAVVYKTWVLLSLLKDQYAGAFVGGAMLRLDNQNIQVEAGSVWNKGQVMSLKSGLDLRNLDAVLYNELEETADYNAWWYCVVPIENVRADNLPMPIFIRGDDVEYGLRNTKQLILMNGICVWHEPFENKYSSSMFYYIFRNRLIDNSVRGIKWKRRAFIKELKAWISTEIKCMRYTNVYLLTRGVNDFLKGIDWLKAQDGEALHKEIMGISYKLKYVDELDFTFSYPKYEESLRKPDKEKGFKGRIKNFVRKISYNGLFIKAKYDVIVPTVEVRPVQLFRAKRALSYDLNSRKGFVTEKSVKKAVKCYLRYLQTYWKVRFNYKKIVKQYNSRKGELTSLNFWNEYLNIDASADKPVEPVAEQPVEQPVVQEVAATEAIPEPVVEVAEPVQELITEVTEPAQEPVTEEIAPVVLPNEQQNEPAQEVVTEPVAEPIQEVVAEPVQEPVQENIEENATEVVAEAAITETENTEQTEQKPQQNGSSHSKTNNGKKHYKKKTAYVKRK